MIRKATLADIDELNKLLNILFTQELEFMPNTKVQKKALKKIINSKKIGDIFVLTKQKKIVAMVNILYTFSSAIGKKVAILEDMVVLKKYRKKGLGSKLLKKVLDILDKDEISRVTLLSDNDNKVAHQFYEKLGFKKSSMIVLRK